MYLSSKGYINITGVVGRNMWFVHRSFQPSPKPGDSTPNHPMLYTHTLVNIIPLLHAHIFITPSITHQCQYHTLFVTHSWQYHTLYKALVLYIINTPYHTFSHTPTHHTLAHTRNGSKLLQPIQKKAEKNIMGENLLLAKVDTYLSI